MLEESATLDVSAISRVGINFNLKRKENVPFIVSLYELDKTIEEKSQLAAPLQDSVEDIATLRKTVPP